MPCEFPHVGRPKFARIVDAYREMMRQDQPAHVRCTQQRMLESQSSECGHDYVTLYFRGSNDALIASTTIDHKSPRSETIPRAIEDFERLHPKWRGKWSLCFE